MADKKLLEVFNNIAKKTNVWGQVIPEIGYSAPIEFVTPNTYSSNVMELYWDM